MADEQSLLATVIGVLTFIGEVLVLLVRVCYTWTYCTYQFFMPPEPKSVKGEIILITGTGHGIGRELALRFGKLGATLVCVDINEKGNKETVDMIKSQKGKVYQYQCDVTDRVGVFALAEKVRKEVGDVTILVNNAGIMPCRPLLEQSEKEVRTVLDINVTGNIWTLQAFLDPMLKKNHGHVVALASMAGLMGVANLVPYCGSKFGVRGVMQALELELAENKNDYSGIHFTTICPMVVDTGLCHKPVVSRPSLMPIIQPGDAADQIVNAVRRNYREITVNSDLYYYNKIFSVMPWPVQQLFTEFMGTGVDPHD